MWEGRARRERERVEHRGMERRREVVRYIIMFLRLAAIACSIRVAIL